MKKSISVNISGFIFYIDEDACPILENYLAAIKRNFKNSESRDEIIADIEARIAEMFREKIQKDTGQPWNSESRRAITITDIEQVIAVMGKPEDFGDGDNVAGDNSTNGNNVGGENSNNSSTGPNTNENSNAERKTSRRLFRDTDSRVLGGVCSGISAYFDLDPIWLRLIFAFSFFWLGTGFLLYLILWIILPKAVTTAEKLQMKGERVNISNIEKTIHSEFDILKNKVNDLNKEIHEKGFAEKLRDFVEKVVLLFVQLITGLFRAIAKFIGFILIVVGMLLLALVVSSFFGLSNIISISSDTGVLSFSIKEFLVKFFSSENQVSFSAFGLLLVIGIPLLAIVFGGFRLIVSKGHRKSKAGKVIGSIATAAWIVGLIICLIVGSQIAKDFSVSSDKKEKIAIAQPNSSNALYLDLINGGKSEEGENAVQLHSGKWNISSSGDIQNLMSKPELEIIKSETDSFTLEIVQMAKGKNKKEAVMRASNISYQINQHDSTLEFGKYFSMPENEKWRGQSIKFVLKVPVGKSVHLSNNLSEILIDKDNVSDILTDQKEGLMMKMTEKGLK